MIRSSILILLLFILPSSLRAQQVTDAEVEAQLEEATQQRLREHEARFVEAWRLRREALTAGQGIAAQVLPQDSLALVALYNATNGLNWTNNTNWLTGPVHTWHGITVVGNRVTEVDLGLNDVGGSLPSHLGKLTALVLLKFRINDLTGSIPPELGNLLDLEWLDLHGNPLTGSIPPKLGSLTNLIHLNLSSTQLTGSIPPELGNLASLEWLTLGSPLTGPIPPMLGDLTKLKYLQVNFCQLSGSIPPELGNLSNLIWLAFYNNNLTGSLPSELGNLNIQTLLFWNNQLSGSIPPGFWNNTNLQTIRLRDNQLTGSISPQIGNLINLEILSLGGNNLTGALPSTLATLGSADLLLFHDNAIEDVPDLSAMSPLSYFRVQGNRLTFEDIEPNVAVLTSYDPQALVGTPRTETVDEGQDVTLHLPVGGANNEYQWYKDGLPIASATTDTYTLVGATSADAGLYTLEITNTVVMALTLQSHPITVVITVRRYVATGGNDSGNDCTHPATPCATLAHAVSQANDGDTIELAAGVYNEPGLVIDKVLTILGQGVIVQ